MTQLSPIIQREILDQDYVSIQDLRYLYGWSKTQATSEFKTFLNDEESKGKKIMTRGRMVLIPLDIVLEKYPLSYQRIDRAAKRILGEKNKWQREDI